MTLYVDNARTPLGRMRMSHLMADSPEELERARRALGLPRSALHHPGTPDEHLDVGQTKRQLAIEALGAQQVSSRYLVSLRQARRREQQP